MVIWSLFSNSWWNIWLFGDCCVLNTHSIYAYIMYSVMYKPYCHSMFEDHKLKRYLEDLVTRLKDLGCRALGLDPRHEDPLKGTHRALLHTAWNASRVLWFETSSTRRSIVQSVDSRYPPVWRGCPARPLHPICWSPAPDSSPPSHTSETTAADPRVGQSLTWKRHRLQHLKSVEDGGSTRRLEGSEFKHGGSVESGLYLNHTCWYVMLQRVIYSELKKLLVHKQTRKHK